MPDKERLAADNSRKPDITELLRDQLKLAIMTRCNNDEHQRIDQPCAWCDDVCNDLTAYAIARAQELRAEPGVDQAAPDSDAADDRVPIDRVVPRDRAPLGKGAHWPESAQR